jgi:hypothetical protein
LNKQRKKKDKSPSKTGFFIELKQTLLVREVCINSKELSLFRQIYRPVGIIFPLH